MESRRGVHVRASPSAAPRKINIAAVARAAGVSISTVSRILNGGSSVREAKRQAVEAAIARLGFRPDPLARGLRKGRRMTVGIVALNTPFFAAAFRGISDALAASDYAALVLSGPPGPEPEIQRMEQMLARRVDGIITLTCRVPNAVLRRTARTVPVVVAGRDLDDRNLFSLRIDNVLGGELATRHLLQLGHRAIAHLSGPLDHQDALDRIEGYRRALREAGVRFDPRLVVTAGFGAHFGLTAVNELLDRDVPFTAVFAANDECAAGARLGLHQRGLRVPEDVSLVGFDDLPAAQYAIPPMTTVRQPIEEIGRRAVRALLDLLEGDTPSSAGLPEVELIIRQTTAPPP